MRQAHGYGEPVGPYGEPTYSRLGGGKSGSYADLANNRMPSYGEQIHQNFGVRLRPSEPQPHRLRPPNPCDRGEGHIGLGGPLVERLVYLPPDPRDESPRLLDVYDDMKGILVFSLLYLNQRKNEL